MSEAQTQAPPAAPPPVMPPPVGASPAAPPAGDAVPDWRASLPAEVRDAPGVVKFKSVEELARGYVNAETMIGKKGVILPGDNAPPEEVAKFREAIGVPAQADGYKLAGKEGAPPEIWNDATAKEIAAFAHEAALTPKQAQALADKWQTLGIEGGKITAAENERQHTEGKAALQKEWGTSFDAKHAAANLAIKQFGGDEIVALLAEKGLGNDPRMVKLFAQIGEKMGEDVPSGMGQSMAGGPDLKAESATLRAGPAYLNAMHPEHRAVNERLTVLAGLIAAKEGR